MRRPYQTLPQSEALREAAIMAKHPVPDKPRGPGLHILSILFIHVDNAPGVLQATRR